MNNSTIPQSSANNLYVAHSVKQKKEKKETTLNVKDVKAEAPAPQAQTIQYINRSYYYDSTGGGYQGL